LSRVKRARRRQSSFRCRHCRLDVSLDAPGTMHRNHCPSCLWSRHLDEHVPGDRASVCGGSMEPVAVHVRDDGELALVHRCRGCAAERLNRIAGDDNAHVLHNLGGVR
jgi:RNHCP domain-containing protein